MLNQIEHGSILELSLARPPVNALNPSLVSVLRGSIADALSAGYRGLILSGAPGIFSAGLDVPTLLTLDRQAMADFWRDFSATMRALATSPIPTVAAITGHSPAGGAVLAIWCDYRVMASGEFRIGLNETQVGLALPAVIARGLQRLVGAYRAERLIVEGALIDPSQALDIGLVDQLSAPENVIADAIGWLQRHLALPPAAFAVNRRICRMDLASCIDQTPTDELDRFLDGWFSAESQDTLRNLVAKLRTAS
ncbi:MAG: enoyl-CoA hydratase/isomerase family protein [Xanthomonadales bacterium]|nr:enoyl-CoA hydratase/isomerase family protein [Xanthomonadales bacterium]